MLSSSAVSAVFKQSHEAFVIAKVILDLVSPKVARREGESYPGSHIRVLASAIEKCVDLVEYEKDREGAEFFCDHIAVQLCKKSNKNFNHALFASVDELSAVINEVLKLNDYQKLSSATKLSTEVKEQKSLGSMAKIQKTLHLFIRFDPRLEPRELYQEPNLLISEFKVQAWASAFRNSTSPPALVDTIFKFRGKPLRDDLLNFRTLEDLQIKDGDATDATFEVEIKKKGLFGL